MIYNDSYDYLKNEDIEPYDKITLISNKVRIFKFLNANVKGGIEYSHTNFIVRSTLGHWYPVDDSTGVHVSSGCERYRFVYVCITVKGSRVCGHCNVLAVRKYVRASMV